MKTEVHAGSESYFTVRRITTIALLSSIAIVLSITPIGFIQVGAIRITFMHIPVIIAAIVEGPVAGGIVGLIFGISSLVTNLSGPMAPVFINPLVSVLPRVLIGIIAAYVYRATKKMHVMSLILTSAVGTAVNTIGVLGMIYLVAAPEFIRIKGITMANMGKILLGVAALNGSLEIAAAIILVTAIIGGLNSIRR